MKLRKRTIGSLCTGYGGLDMAVMAVFDGRLTWCADNDRHVATFLAARFPDIPNLGDLAQLDWHQAGLVDILCAGFPCQDISSAGRGAGIEKGAKSGIWKHIVTGLRVLRPKLVVVENVSAIRYRGLGRVLGDLATLGYDAVWTSVRASDVGAPHQRERVFILGYAAVADIPPTADTLCVRSLRQSDCCRTYRSRTPASALGRGGLTCSRAADNRRREQINWRQYEPAIRRWESLTGRPAPNPIESGTKGQPRLSPRFSEWLMGLPRGFVTDLPLPYSAQHRLIGNGVVPQQAVQALQDLLALITTVYHREQTMSPRTAESPREPL